MDWLGNIGKGIGDFVSWVNPFDDDDKDKRKRDNKVAPKKPTPKPKPTPLFGQNQNNPFELNQNQNNPFQTKQNQNNPFNLDFTANDTKINDLTTQVNGQTVAKAPQVDKKVTDRIPGYKVMSPAAQSKAVAKQRQQNKTKAARYNGLSDEDRKTAISLEKRGKDTTAFIKAARQAAEAKKESDWNNSLLGKLTNFGGEVWDMTGDPVVKTVETLGNMGASSIVDITGGDEHMKKAAREKTKESFDKSAPGYFFNALGTLGTALGGSLAGKKMLDEGVDPKVVQDAMDSYTEQYGLSSKQSDLENSLTLGTAGLTTAFGAASPVVTGIEGTIILPLTRSVISKVGRKADPKAIKTAIQESEKELSVKLSDTEKRQVEEAVKGQAQTNNVATEAAEEFTPEQLKKIRDAENKMAEQNKGKLTDGLLDENGKPTVAVHNTKTGEWARVTPEQLNTLRDETGNITGFSSNDPLHISRISALDSSNNKTMKEVSLDDMQANSPALREALGKAQENIEAPVAKSQEAVTEQKAQQAEQNSVKQGGGLDYNSMMARLQQRRETGQPAQDTRAASVQKEAPTDYSDAALEQRLSATGLSQADVNNLTTQYGMSKMDWQILLNRVGDMSKARSKPAVVASELKKMRAEGIHGQTKAAMNNDVTAQRLAQEAEEATPITQTEGGTVVDAPADSIEIEPKAAFDNAIKSGNEWVKDYMYMGNDGDTMFFKHPETRENVQLKVGETKIIDTPAGGTVMEEPDFNNGDWKTTDTGYVNTKTGEMVDIDPNYGRGTSPDDEIPELTAASPLQEAITKATAIVEDLDESVRKMGLDPEDLRRKKQAANRGEYEMTDLEQAASVIHTQRLNEARQVLADSGLEFDGSQMHYTPQVRQGEAGLPATREELTNFGYANQRKNAIPLEELDYSNLAEIDYIVKAENKDLVIADSIQRAAEVDGRPVTPESVQAATKQTMDLQNKIADAKGSEKVINSDTVSDLNQIGKNEGYTQKVNKVKAGKVSQEPREMLTRAGVYDKGFVQYDNSAGYANEFTQQVIDNNVPTQQLNEALTQSIRSAMPNAEKSTVDEAVASAVTRIKNRNLQGEDIMPQVMSAFRSVSKAEMFRLGKTTSFSDKKMQAVVNEQMNARLLQDNYSKNFAQEFDSFIAQRINASLRGMNVVSALFELGDVANIASNYGVKNIKNAKFGFGKVDDDFLGMSKRYGEADPHFLSSDLPQVNKLNEIWSESTTIPEKLKRSYETGENKLLIFRYVEQYKTELFFRQADNYWRSQGLQGTELVNQVQKDYLNTMLPNKIITANRLLGKLPKSLTQYLNWSVQATKRLGRTIGGSNEAGVFRDMSRGSRIARGVSTELVPKVAAAAVLGVPIQQILGMRDWTGATDGDFSGIAEEDKTALDNVMSYVGMSPTLGFVSNLYYAHRREEEAVEDGEEANDNWLGEAVTAESTKLIPFYTQIKKSLGVQDAVNEGYFENQDGRVQFDAPDAGSLNHLLGLVTGKTYTRENRDYGDNPDLLSVLQGKASLGDLLTHNQTTDNLMQTLGFDTARGYERPVSDNDFIAGRDKDGDLVKFNYNEWVKEQYKEGHDKGGAVLAQAKEYNEALDNLRYQNPDVYEAYLDIMDDKDLVSPERWAALTGTNSEGGFDLTLVRMMGDRKKAVAQAAADSLGKPEYANNYDPMYNLDDEQLRSVLQQKSTATGDDIALRNVLYKSEWYQEYMAESRQYYDQQLFSDEDFGNTERVNKWNDYNTSLSQLSFMQPSEYDSEEVLEQKAALREQFPYNAAYQAAKKEYEDKTGEDFYGSEESTQWYAQYGDGKKAEDGQLDAAKLALINQMREIEGFPPMSEDEYTQATEIANTSNSSGGGGSGGGSRGGGSHEPLPNISNDFTWQSISDALKTSKVRAFKPNTSVGRRTNSRKSMGAKARGGDTYTV